MKLLKAAALFALLFAMGVGIRDARATSPAGAVDRATGIATCNGLLPTNGVGSITAAGLRQCTTLIWNSMLASLSNLADCGSPSACLLSLGGTAGPASSVSGHIATFADATGKVLQDGGLPNSGVAGPGSAVVGHAVTWGNAGATSLLDSGTGLRQILAATTTFYVNPSSSSTAACGAFTCGLGADNASCGLVAASPCLTLTYATARFAAAYDFAGQTVNVQAADGTFNECVNLPVYLTTSNTDKNVFILGHAGSPLLVTVTCAGFNAFTAVNSPQGWVLKNINVNASNACLFADYHSSIFWDGGNFNTCTNAQAQAGGPGSFIEFVNHPYTISGGSQFHALAGSLSEILWQSTATFTISGSPTFSQGLLSNARSGLIDEHFTSFTGAFTGKTYLLSGPTMQFSTAGVASTSAATRYIGPSKISATESDTYQSLATPVTEIVDLNVNVVTAPGGSDTYTFTLRQGGSDTNLTCTITGAAFQCNDSVHLSGNSYNAGALLDLKMVSSATAATTVVSASVVLRP